MSTLLNGSFPPLFDKASGSPIPKDKITANDVMPAILYILFALGWIRWIIRFSESVSPNNKNKYIKYFLFWNPIYCHQTDDVFKDKIFIQLWPWILEIKSAETRQ